MTNKKQTMKYHSWSHYQNSFNMYEDDQHVVILEKHDYCEYTVNLVLSHEIEIDANICMWYICVYSRKCYQFWLSLVCELLFSNVQSLSSFSTCLEESCKVTGWCYEYCSPQLWRQLAIVPSSRNQSLSYIDSFQKGTCVWNVQKEY